MTTTWQIHNTKRRLSDGLVLEVAYGCTAELENFIDRKVGKLQLTGDPSVPGFIPYENLTQEVIIGWVKASLGDSQVAAIETGVQNNVTAQKTAKDNITEVNGLPWIQ
jgi:hypothetical protein